MGLFFLAMVLFFVSLFFQRRSSPKSPLISQDAQVLWSPHLNTVNAQGDEYTVCTKKMIYREKEGYVFDDVEGCLTNKEGRVFFLSAKKGVYHDAGRVFLQGEVCSHTNDGWRMKTQSAVFFLEKSCVEGDEHVEGTGPLGTFAADGFFIESTRIILKKNAEITITTENDVVPLAL